MVLVLPLLIMPAPRNPLQFAWHLFPRVSFRPKITKFLTYNYDIPRNFFIRIKIPRIFLIHPTHTPRKASDDRDTNMIHVLSTHFIPTFSKTSPEHRLQHFDSSDLWNHAPLLGRDVHDSTRQNDISTASDTLQSSRKHFRLILACKQQYHSGYHTVTTLTRRIKQVLTFHGKC